MHGNMEHQLSIIICKPYNKPAFNTTPLRLCLQAPSKSRQVTLLHSPNSHGE